MARSKEWHANPSTTMPHIVPDMALALELTRPGPGDKAYVPRTDDSDPWYSIHDCLKKCPIWATKDARCSALKRVLQKYSVELRPLLDHRYLLGKNHVLIACMQLSGLALLLGAMGSAKWSLATGKGARNKSKGGKRAREEGEEDDFFAGGGPIPAAAPVTDSMTVDQKIKLKELEVELQREARLTVEAQTKVAEAESVKLRLQLASVEAQKGQSTGSRSPCASPRSPSPVPPKPKQPASDDRPQYATEAMSSFTALFHEVVNRRVSKIQFALAAQHVAQQYHQAYKKQPEMRAKHHMYPNSCADNVKKWVWEWIRERALGKRARSDCA